MLHCAPPLELCLEKGLACVWEDAADSRCRILNVVLTVPAPR